MKHIIIAAVLAMTAVTPIVAKEQAAHKLTKHTILHGEGAPIPWCPPNQNCGDV